MEATLANVLWILFAFLIFGGVVAFAVANMVRNDKDRNFPNRMSSMMTRLGIDPSAAVEIRNEYYMRIAASTCHHCKSKTQCDEWLAAQGSSSTAPAFCPNARYLHLARVEGRRVGPGVNH